MSWHDFLRPDEIAELTQIKAGKIDARKRERQIYDRCRKRMKKDQSNG